MNTPTIQTLAASCRFFAVTVLICTAYLATSAGHAAPVVSNVAAAQREGTKLVDITYDISGGTPTSTVSLSVSNGGTAVATPSVTGDVGAGVADGTGKTVTWDGGADADDLLATLVFSVLAVAVEAPSDTYLVIDLSGGTTATSYPVTKLANVPAGGWTSAHKTTSLVLRHIPAGTFTMGSPGGESGRASDETQNPVTLTTDFYIGVFEVTQRQWELVMGANPSTYPGVERPVEGVSYDAVRGASSGWPASGTVAAGSFIDRLRVRTGLSIDLPTEAQWEYACRAGTTRAYNDYTQNEGTGSNNLSTGFAADANLEPLGWYLANANGEHRIVGLKQPNFWGLYDMHGNVYEWCLDWYGDYFLGVSDPDNVRIDPRGAVSGSRRVLRGGSADRTAPSSRSAARLSQVSGLLASANGLRLASLPPIN